MEYTRVLIDAAFVVFFFFFKQKTAYEIRLSLVGSEMCIRDRCTTSWKRSGKHLHSSGILPGIGSDPLWESVELAPKSILPPVGAFDSAVSVMEPPTLPRCENPRWCRRGVARAVHESELRLCQCARSMPIHEGAVCFAGEVGEMGTTLRTRQPSFPGSGALPDFRPAQHLPDLRRRLEALLMGGTH